MSGGIGKRAAVQMAKEAGKGTLIGIVLAIGFKVYFK